MPVAERLGLTVAVENMERRPGEVVVTADHLRQLRARYASPAFGTTLDFCHAATHGLVAEFLELASAAAHVHMSDLHPAAAPDGPGGTEAHVARWGTGALDIARVLARLGEVGYAGAVVCEGEPDEDPWVTVRANAAVWRSLMGDT